MGDSDKMPEEERDKKIIEFFKTTFEADSASLDGDYLICLCDTQEV